MECYQLKCSRVDTLGVDALMMVPCRYKTIGRPFVRNPDGSIVGIGLRYGALATVASNCLFRRNVAGFTLYGITDLLKISTYYYIQLGSIWKPWIMPDGRVSRSTFLFDRPSYSLGNFPVFWNPDVPWKTHVTVPIGSGLEEWRYHPEAPVVYAHQVYDKPLQTLGPNPYIPNEYVSQEEINDIEMFDFFHGKAKRESYFGQDLLLKTWADEYKNCAAKYKPQKPSP